MNEDIPENEHSEPQDYKVGYGRPPKATQFKPGQSGNPKGRKAKPKSVQEQMRMVLSKKVEISEGGKTKRLTLQEVMLRNIANKAAKGDLRAASFVLGLLNSEAASESDTIDQHKLSNEDLALFEQMMAELSPPLESPAPNEGIEHTIETLSLNLNEQKENANDA